MAKYGNVIMLFSDDSATEQEVELLLTQNNVVFLKYERNYFIETSSMTNTSAIIAQLKAQAITFLFLHLHNSDGSQAKGNNIAQPTLDQINTILFN